MVSGSIPCSRCVKAEQVAETHIAPDAASWVRECVGEWFLLQMNRWLKVAAISVTCAVYSPVRAAQESTSKGATT